MIGLVLGLHWLLDIKIKFFVFLRITEIYKEKLSKKEIGGALA
jgi:hypothetical protein